MHLNTFAQLLSSAMSNGEEQTLSAGSERLKLSHLFSSEVAAQMLNRWNNHNASPCSVPCFQLKGHLSGSDRSKKSSIPLIDVAALNLSTPLYASARDIDTVPSQLLANITASFKQLLTSRLRASMIALINQTTKLGEYEEADVLQRLLFSKKAIDIVTVVTSFTVINDKSGVTGRITKPIFLDAIIDVSMLGKMHTRTFQVPGSITAVINPTEFLLDSAHVTFDTVEFLKKMIVEARLLIKLTLQRAAKITATYSSMNHKKSHVDLKEDQRYEGDHLHAQPAVPPSSTEQYLSSYPQHLRETVRQFLPAEDTVIEANIEGFPPQLARTLKLLANGGGEGEKNLPVDDNEFVNNSGLSTYVDNGNIGVGAFSNWTNNEPSSDGSNLSFSSMHSFSNPRPLKKRKRQVSFTVPMH
jgi:hypothetical protein